MDKERFPSKDLPIEELVERYLSLPNNIASDLKDLPEDLDYLVEKDREVCDGLREFVQDGTLDPGTADNAIKNTADFLKESYPEYKKSIDTIYLFDRGIMWVARAIYLESMGAQKSEIERVQENTARLYLRTGLAMGVISSILSNNIVNALLTSGHQTQAEMVATETFGGIFLVNDREEAVKFAQKAGEKDPRYYKEGIFRVSKEKLDKSGLN
jgi:hypothetical protein